MCHEYGTVVLRISYATSTYISYTRETTSSPWVVSSTYTFQNKYTGNLINRDSRGTATGLSAFKSSHRITSFTTEPTQTCVNETSDTITETIQNIIRPGSTVTVTGISSDRAGNAFDISELQSTRSPDTYSYITHINRDDACLLYTSPSPRD